MTPGPAGHDLVVGFSPEVERALAEQFPGEATPSARAILQPDQDDRVLLAVLALCRGDLERLRHFSEAAAADWRDVLYWAENPPADDEPRTYEELRERLGLPLDT
jgi:hypothetical protein